LRITPGAERILLILALITVVSALLVNPILRVNAESTSEYQRYVHNFTNSGPLGNWTYVEKPFFPVFLTDSQIPVGQNWSIVCPLQASHEYHAYCYGRWVSDSSANKTDYDVYIYDPSGTLEGYHTASAGQYEHLGTGMNEPFFTPKYTGNYTFTISNDARESSRADQATFMIIENVEPNAWHECQIEGKDDNGLPQYRTSWAYEFVTESPQVEVQIKVPLSLDMYEARLFLMANNASASYTTLDGIPLALESGLYGNKTGNIGGYNTDSQGYQGMAFANCDKFGQDMLIRFNSTAGKSLYHLVFIGEKGSGNISFLVKTSLDQELSPVENPDRVFPEEGANITYVSSITDLVNATLQFSIDNWQTNFTKMMNVLDDNRTCRTTIPPQPQESNVLYRVEATDVLGEILTANGSYRVAPTERTYLDKPMFPVFFNESQIAIGREWSVICSLEENHSYHTYCYGEWVNTGSNPITNYDMYLYDPTGQMVGYHTPSAGLPPHLGTTIGEPFFVPQQTGNYTFVISNNPFASKGAQQATFMIIEDAECNVWHQRYLDGMNSQSLPTLNTSWAYEFMTNSPLTDVYVKVPETLDMYEARLYLMTDPRSKNQTLLNDVPLAWELGLYGNKTKADPVVGGYSLDSKEYRGNAYASCEFYGENMHLNFTSPTNQTTLYHLVLIGEVGNGTVQFLIKTEFNNTHLTPNTVPGRVYPGANTTVAYMAAMAELDSAVLKYSIDNWASLNTTNMSLSNGTCTGVIPGQEAGTTVHYNVIANDTMENTLTVNGIYTVKYSSALNFTSIQDNARPGEEITFKGTLTPAIKDMPVTIYFVSANETNVTACFTSEDGTFSGSFKPETVGTWVVYASFNGSATVYDSQTSMATLRVEETMFSKYSLYIFGGIGAVTAVGIAIYIKKSKA
jgi:hypothetical protein